MKRPEGSLLVPAALAVLAGIVFIPLWPLGFLGDDFHHLMVAGSHSPLDLLSGRAARDIAPTYFTPLLQLSFWIDRTLFGLAAWGYTLHNFVWLWIAGLATYALFLAAGIRWLPAGLAAALAMLAPTTVSVSAYYSTRHYLFGLAWMLFSLAAAVRWSRRGGARWLAAALACYLIAALSKETFVPLLVAAPLLASGGGRKRLGLLAAYLGTTALYLSWRTAAIGLSCGTVSPGGHDPAGVLTELIRSWPRLSEAVIGGSVTEHVNWAAVVGATALLSAGAFLAWRRAGPRGLAADALLIAASLGPTALVLGDPRIRYADRLVSCLDDRLALGFGLCLLLGFVYLLFVDETEKPDRRKERLKIWGTIALVIAVAAGGIWTAREWRHHRPPDSFWRQVIDHRREEIYLVGPFAFHRREMIKLLAASDPEVRVKAVFEDRPGEGTEEPEPSKVRLHLPHRELVPAASREQARDWTMKYGRNTLGPRLQTREGKRPATSSDAPAR